jgi:hypothetical protein
MDRVIDALQRSLIGHNAIALSNGMHGRVPPAV